MRSLMRTLASVGVALAAAAALEAQSVRPRRPSSPTPSQVRERAIERREQMREQVRERVREQGRERVREQGRERVRERTREGRIGRVERRVIARRAIIRRQILNLKPEQREARQKYREQLRAERSTIGEELRAGRLTREGARERMQTWREARKPPVERPVERRRRPAGSKR